MPLPCWSTAVSARPSWISARRPRGRGQLATLGIDTGPRAGAGREPGAARPGNPRADCCRCRDALARTTWRWISSLGNTDLRPFAYSSGDPRLALDGTGLLEHILFLIVTVMVVALIFRLRDPVGELIRTSGRARRLAGPASCRGGAGAGRPLGASPSGWCSTSWSGRCIPRARLPDSRCCQHARHGRCRASVARVCLTALAGRARKRRRARSKTTAEDRAEVTARRALAAAAAGLMLGGTTSPRPDDRSGASGSRLAAEPGRRDRSQPRAGW